MLLGQQKMIFTTASLKMSVASIDFPLFPVPPGIPFLDSKLIAAVHESPDYRAQA
jgi:hypothetical protein